MADLNHLPSRLFRLAVLLFCVANVINVSSAPSDHRERLHGVAEETESAGLLKIPALEQDAEKLRAGYLKDLAKMKSRSHEMLQNLLSDLSPEKNSRLDNLGFANARDTKVRQELYRSKRSDDEYDINKEDLDDFNIARYWWVIAIGAVFFVAAALMIICCICTKGTALRRNQKGEWVKDTASPFYLAPTHGYDNMAYACNGETEMVACADKDSPPGVSHTAQTMSHSESD